ncbi:hypothetical protein U1Q18_048845, partial [Sarracenia purpurea var. burkii]
MVRGAGRWNDQCRRHTVPSGRLRCRWRYLGRAQGILKTEHENGVGLRRNPRFRRDGPVRKKETPAWYPTYILRWSISLEYFRA